MSDRNDMVAIASPELSATISPLGAELFTLQDADGRDLLSDGDPAFWSGRSPILFPIVGKLTDDRYRLGDRVYAMEKHGLARKLPFEIVSAAADAALFRLTANDETRAAYPFAFRLELAYRITGDRLEIAATVANDGDQPMPASLGYHPAFRWPLPYGAPRAEHRLLFSAPEAPTISRLGAGAGIDPEPQPSPIADQVLPLADELFENDAVILTALASDRIVYGVPGYPGLAVETHGLPALGIWTKPGAPFICIEPWAGHADPEGFRGDFRDKPGITLIPPGEERRFAITIALVGSVAG